MNMRSIFSLSNTFIMSLLMSCGGWVTALCVYDIKQEDLSDLITALVKLNLFFSTTFPMQCTFQNIPTTIMKY